MAHGRAHCRPSSLPPQFICPCVIEQPIASTRRVLRVADAPATQRRRCQRSRETSPMLARAARWLTSRLERLPTSERWAASTWEQAGDRLAVSMWRTRRQRRQNLRGRLRGWPSNLWRLIHYAARGPLKFLPRGGTRDEADVGCGCLFLQPAASASSLHRAASAAAVGDGVYRLRPLGQLAGEAPIPMVATRSGARA